MEATKEASPIGALQKQQLGKEIKYPAVKTIVAQISRCVWREYRQQKGKDPAFHGKQLEIRLAIRKLADDPKGCNPDEGVRIGDKLIEPREEGKSADRFTKPSMCFQDPQPQQRITRLSLQGDQMVIDEGLVAFVEATVNEEGDEFGAEPQVKVDDQVKRGCKE